MIFILKGQTFSKVSKDGGGHTSIIITKKCHFYAKFFSNRTEKMRLYCDVPYRNYSITYNTLQHRTTHDTVHDTI